MADTIASPHPTHLSPHPNTSHDPPTPHNAYTLPQFSMNLRPASDHKKKVSVDSVLYCCMVATTLANWLVAEMEKHNMLLSKWVPLGFKIVWLFALLALCFWNISKGRRFYFRHIGTVALTALAHTSATQEPSFALVQYIVDVGIFFGNWTESYYPDEGPEGPGGPLLPGPVQAPGRNVLPSRPRRSRQPNRVEEYEL